MCTLCSLPLHPAAATMRPGFPLESIELLPALIRNYQQMSRAEVLRSAGWKTPKPWLHWWNAA